MVNYIKILFVVIALVGQNVIIAQVDSTARQFATISNLLLCESTLDDYMELLGEATMHSGGDAAESYDKICYYLEKNKLFLTIERTEMCVTSLRISKSNPVNNYTTNNIYHISGNDLGGLRLGLSRKSFEKFLPQEFKFIAENNFYQYKTKIEIGNSVQDNSNWASFSELFTIAPTYQNDKLVILQIFRVVSN